MKSVFVRPPKLVNKALREMVVALWGRKINIIEEANPCQVWGKR